MIGKKIVCLVLAALLVLAAVGCGVPAPNQLDTDAVRAAVDKFRSCTSFSIVQLTEIEEMVNMDGEKFVYDVLNKTELSMITEPSLRIRTMVAARMEYDGEQIEQFNLSYLIPENGGYAEYYNDGNEWVKISTEQDVSDMGMGAAAIVDTFFTDKIEFSKVAEETLEGVKAARYEGALGKDDLIALLEVNGLLSGLSSMSENQQARIKENLAKDLEEVSVSVWLDEEQGYPVRFAVDMSRTLNAMEKSIAKSLGNKLSEDEWKVEKYLISMDVSDFNAVGEILLPPEAEAARLYEG